MYIAGTTILLMTTIVITPSELEIPRGTSSITPRSTISKLLNNFINTSSV
jgi:hypothetical protein